MRSIKFQKTTYFSFLKPLMLLLSLLTSPSLFSEDLYSLDHALLSIYVVNSLTKEVLIEKNSEISLMPASCLKVVTTAAALHLLGADSRFETYLEYEGDIDQEKTLHGNLYIRGGGDPCLGSDRIPGNPSWKEQLEIWANAIQKLGIQKVTGKVIGDATRWEKALAVPSWSWEDVGNYYGAGACALSFHENAYSLFFKPGPQVGESASILRTDPPLLPLTFHNEVKTGPEGSGDQACIYGSELSSIQAIRGTIPAAVKEFAIKGAIPDPATYCAAMLVKEIERRGIAIGHQDIPSKGKRMVFHTTYSPPIKEIVHWTNQKSVNLYAEHLLKKMGEVLYQEGSTQAGIKAITSFWKSQSVDLSGFHMVDGSGLSRKNLVTAKQFVQMLLKMKQSQAFPIFFESLPKEEGSLRAKSGSMSLVKGYVGFMGDLAFSLLMNQCTKAKMMDEKIQKILAHLNQISKKAAD